MKLKVSQEKLAFALNTVSKAVSSNNTLPVLNNILLKAEGKNLFFSATNLEIAIQLTTPAEIFNEGSLTIPAKLFTNYINLLQEDTIELKLEEGLTLSIKTESSRTKIKGIGVDEFPLIPKIENPQTFIIQGKFLKEAISQVAFAASSHVSRPVLAGILFFVDKDTLSMVATDSYRLAEKKIALSERVKQSIQCIIPGKTILELGKILMNVSDSSVVHIHISKNQALFELHNIKLITRLIEGAFPDYNKIIPKENKTKIEVDTGDFILAVRKVSLFVQGESNNIKLSATNDGKLTLATGETQVGEETDEISAKVTGENNQIGLNFQFLLDVLHNIGEEKVLIEMDSRLSPVVIKPVKKSDYVHIIMPLKL